MTALDIWLLMCLLFVALATFEYATLLAITFWITNKIGPMEGVVDGKDKICQNIDRIALTMFSIIYVLSVISYFTALLG